jgi:hypothetical protein
VVLYSVGWLADIGWVQSRKRTVALFDEFDRNRSIFVHVPAEFVARFDACFPPSRRWDRDSVALVYYCLILDFLKHKLI